MGFSTRRGRPPRAASAPDRGTPELQRKRASDYTTEAIDLCLERQLITQEQHRAALHLRWLYTIRYGAPQLTTRYLQECAHPLSESESWYAARNAEYLAACALLRQHRLLDAILRPVVDNQRPAFLAHSLRAKAWKQPALASRLNALYQELRHGLDLLVQHWKHPNTLA